MKEAVSGLGISPERWLVGSGSSSLGENLGFYLFSENLTKSSP